MARSGRNRFAMALPGASISVFLSCAVALADNPIVLDAAQACSGITSTAVRASGPIRFNNYSLSVESNGSLSVQQNGVLLRKIQSFNYSDYSKCILDLTKIMVGITAATQKMPIDIFDKVRMGSFGNSGLSYLQTSIGPANEVSATDDPEIKQADFVSDGYKISATYLTKENDKLVSLSVIIDKRSTSRRGEVVIDGYWNKAGETVKPGAVLGVSLMRDKFPDDCYPRVEGGLVTNSDPIYSCLRPGYHSGGWIGVILHLEATGGESGGAYELFRLRDQVQDGPDPSWPLGAERTRTLERAANISRADDQSTKLQKVEAAILRTVRNYRIVGFELFNALSSGK